MQRLAFLFCKAEENHFLSLLPSIPFRIPVTEDTSKLRVKASQRPRDGEESWLIQSKETDMEREDKEGSDPLKILSGR